MKPRTLILRTAGTNCDVETAYAFELVGAQAETMHVNRLLERPALLSEYQIMAIPGGFSYGDDIAAGKIFANQIAHHLREPLNDFLRADKPVIGICNGFQVLVKTDLLPGPLAGRTGQTATLTNNDSGRFVDRWIHLEARPSKCIWTAGLEPLDLPVAHGEGKFVPADDSVRRALWDEQLVALVYATNAEATDRYNPNGSVDDIAGICDASGLVFGLMPHPERHIASVQHPAWRGLDSASDAGPGLQFFQNAVRHALTGVGAGV
jgi:phosphoribosylformylglycinamidine synthase I